MRSKEDLTYLQAAIAEAQGTPKPTAKSPSARSWFTKTKS